MPLEIDTDLYRALIDNSLDVITVLSAEGLILFESPSVRAHLGYEPNELRGRPALDYIHEDDRDAVSRALGTMLESGEPLSTDFRFLHRDGSWRILRGSGRAILHGERRLFLVNSRDVTAQRESVREIERQRDLFAKTFASSCSLKSVSAVGTGRLFDVNAAWEETFGYTREEALGRTALELGCWGDDVAQRERIVGQLGAAGHLRAEEVTFRDRHGAARIVRLDAEIVDLDGEPCVLFSGIDLTDERMTQEQLRQSQRLEALGQLTGGVAHDFNNLLGVILGNADLLRDRIGPDDRGLPLLDALQRATERAASLTHQLLAFARQQPLAPRSIRADARIRLMRPMLESSLRENIELALPEAEELWRCRVDPGQLENAILNLVLNARDAMPAGGSLRIDVRNRTLESGLPTPDGDLPAGDYVEILVEDSGAGIDEADLPKVFEPFFTTKAVGEGTGLGLAMVYGFVRQSGGTIRVESEPERGTCVSLVLPRAGEEPEEAVSHAGDAPPLAGTETILVLEDNDALRSLLLRQLGRLGYRVVEASDENGFEEALRASDRIDLFVSDMALPGAHDGAELAARLQAEHPEASVLLISGNADWSRLDLPETVSFLDKPFRMADFARCVRERLDA